MKIKYTKYLNILVDSRKQIRHLIGEKKSYKEIVNDLFDGIFAFQNGNYSLTTNASLDCVRAVTELNVLEGKRSMNFFFTDIKFCEWLASCVINEIASDIVDEFHKKYGDICLFHFPANKEYTSFMTINSKNIDNKYLLDKRVVLSSPSDFVAVYYFNGQDNACYDLKQFDYTSFDEHIWVTEDDKKNNRKHFKIYAGLCLYLECFPEMLKDGVPSDFDKSFNYEMNQPKTIEISDKVRYNEHDSPTAHYRSGHFRTLKNERYVNKRYQVIFVHGCFVKGEAKTILNSEQNVMFV